MTGDWRKLALAAAAAIALAATGAPHGVAQAPAKAGAKKAPAKEADSEAEANTAKHKRQDPVEAERAIDAAFEQLEAGKSAEAAHALTRVINGGGLPPAIMAKALLYRGIAYRQLKKPAQAIADLTGALWLKGGLSEADRGDALKQRVAAYQEAGLAASREPAGPAPAHPAAGPPPRPGGPRRPRPGRTPPRNRRLLNPLGRLFGRHPPPPVPPPPAPPAPRLHRDPAAGACRAAAGAQNQRLD